MTPPETDVSRIRWLRYVKVRSWHVVTGVRADGTGVVTRCGLRRPPETTSATLPLDEPSCETCLRLTAHDEAKA